MEINWGITSQLLGLIISTGLTAILIFILYWFVIRKQKLGYAPSNKLMLILEVYYSGFIKMINGLSGGKLKWSYTYLFTLFNFIIINSLMPWIGVEAAPTTIMFTLPLAVLTFIGLIIIGFGTLGFIGFIKHKYSNPIEIIMQFSPVISMSVRLFGATFAGAIIGNVPWIIISGIIGNVNDSHIVTWAPVVQSLIMFIWKIIDTLLSLIQAFVFISLTIIFWVIDSGPTWSISKRREIKKKLKKERSNKTVAEVIIDFKSIGKNNE